MALITEDGTGVAGAESYITVAAADTYFTDRGDTVWTALAVPAKEAALRKGTDYMEGAFRSRWKGRRVLSTQALSWPRYSVVVDGILQPSNIVPATVARACAELALRASAAPLAPDLGAQVKQETVGPISVTYADGARQSDRFQAVDRMLAAYLRGGGMIPVVRE